MKVIIDTSSLLSLVRYYLPFDQNTILYDFVKSEVSNGNLIIIDAVFEECEYTTQGLVLKSLDYLTDKEFKKNFKLPIRTKDLLPPSSKKFYNLLNHNFRTPLSRRLNDAEFEERKKEFLETADARMIILALIKKSANEEIAIVTEETETGNDHKAFKKIPALCKILDIKVMALPDLLKVYQGIAIEFK
ncbi:DUF4411 family protein [Owenweeksia hongkongensis]|uniref:DUF4411 family protein n=1 Tax=Owenweeksia hongkongensis TaxID=253245 RepID=UPI003A8F5753